jgi:acetylornithine deacetylase/succinyl-diaminopimelate desuccinylase-like protein
MPIALRAHVLLAVLLSTVPVTAAAQENPASRAARRWRQQHERAIVEEFIALLSIPNIASDRDNIQKNAQAIAAMMERRGIPARLVSVAGGNPVVLGDIRMPGATRTIAFYAHYDGQPLDPREWTTPPFQPTLRDKRVEDGGRVVPLPAAAAGFDPEWRLYARGAADDKAPIIALLTAIDAIRDAAIALRSNVKLVFEGEEEAGSANLERTLAENKALFAADLWLMCDAPLYQTRQQSIIFGARGVAQVDITVYGPRTELHSGHYGNWAPNPAMTLARLLASMKDDSGKVLVGGFYDQVEPLGEVERRALAEAPLIDAALKQEFWLGATDGGISTLNELITQPSLNVRGMASSRVGAQASNVIPATATATLDVRLVKGMNGPRTGQLIAEHARKQGFFVVDREPTADERRAHPRVAQIRVNRIAVGSRTSMDLPISREVIRTVESARGPSVKLPTMGGGLPLDSIERPLGVPTIVIPMGNHDNNQHSFDENLRIQNLWDGIELMAALLAM